MDKIVYPVGVFSNRSTFGWLRDAPIALADGFCPFFFFFTSCMCLLSIRPGFLDLSGFGLGFGDG